MVNCRLHVDLLPKESIVKKNKSIRKQLQINKSFALLLFKNMYIQVYTCGMCIIRMQVRIQSFDL